MIQLNYNDINKKGRDKIEAYAINSLRNQYIEEGLDYDNATEKAEEHDNLQEKTIEVIKKVKLNY